MKRVLVVDDDDDVRELVSALLRGRYAVSAAADGVAGLEAALRERPDLVILDLLMPRMHGFEVCRRIRAEPSLSGTRVLVSSLKTYAHDQRTAVEEAGADGFLVKPFTPEELQARVDALLGGA